MSVHIGTSPHTRPGALVELAEQIQELADAVTSAPDRTAITQRMIDFAIRGIPGAEHASLTLADLGQPPRTTARSDEPTYEWDQLQYQCGEGPCLEVISTSTMVLARDLRIDTRWPRYAHALVEQTPVRSMLSFRPYMTPNHGASLNLYATRASVFTDESVAAGSIFTAFLSTALPSETRQANNRDLAAALASNREIGVAIGILMTGGRMTEEQAFRQLATASANLNGKLAAIAEDVAASGELPRFTRRSLRVAQDPHRFDIASGAPSTTSLGRPR